MDKQVTAILTVVLAVGFVLLIIGILIVVVMVQNAREQERTRQLQDTAILLGWQFAAAAPMNWIPNLASFELFKLGRGRKIKNMLYGELDGVKSALFDYQYTISSGKSSVTHIQSVVYFEPRNLSLPLFSLRPESAVHKLLSAFGYQDIDFGNRPEFSKMFLLRGPDEQAVRNAFNDAALSFYEMNPGTSTDGGGSQLFIFKHSQRAQPQETQSFINWGLAFKNLFGHQW